METIVDFFKSHKPQSVFFLVFMAACIPMLYYYRRRNPNPRFRPTVGEMTLMTLFCAFLSGGLAVGLGGVFNEHQDFRKLADKPTGSEDLTDSTSAGRKSGNKPKKDDATKLIDAIKGEK
jgi:hypothetical protein